MAGPEAINGISLGTDNFNRVAAVNMDEAKKKQNSVFAPPSFNAVIQGIGNLLNGSTAPSQSDGACFSA